LFNINGTTCASTGSAPKYNQQCICDWDLPQSHPAVRSTALPDLQLDLRWPLRGERQESAKETEEWNAWEMKWRDGKRGNAPGINSNVGCEYSLRHVTHPSPNFTACSSDIWHQFLTNRLWVVALVLKHSSMSDLFSVGDCLMFAPNSVGPIGLQFGLRTLKAVLRFGPLKNWNGREKFAKWSISQQLIVPLCWIWIRWCTGSAQSKPRTMAGRWFQVAMQR